MARTFGPKTVGRVCGFMYLISALFGLLQYPLVLMTTTRFNGQLLNLSLLACVFACSPCVRVLCAGDYFVMNLIQVLVALVCVPLTVRLVNRERALSAQTAVSRDQPVTVKSCDLM